MVTGSIFVVVKSLIGKEIDSTKMIIGVVLAVIVGVAALIMLILDCSSEMENKKLSKEVFGDKSSAMTESEEQSDSSSRGV